MKIAFCQNRWDEPHGPVMLSETLEAAGHDVRFFLEQRHRFSRLLAYGPDVVALSTCTGLHHFMLDTATRIKTAAGNAPLVVMGGPHATFNPQVIEHPAIDALCRGEADEVFPAFVSAIDNRRMPEDVPGFWVKQNGRIVESDVVPLVKNLSALPVSTRRPLYRDYPFLATMPFKRVLVTRGCPFDCGYCFNHQFRQLTRGQGPFVRRRTVDHVLEEIRYLKDHVPVRYIDFTDDTFAQDKTWLAEFATRYPREIGLPFGCNLQPSLADDDTCRMLSAAGCHFVAFAVETGSEALRKEVLGRDISDEQILECGRLLHRHRIPFQTFSMLDLPGETLDQAMETVRLNQAVKPAFPWVSLAVPLPGTRFARKWSQIEPEQADRAWERFDGNWFGRSTRQGPEARRIENLHKFFYWIVRYPRLWPVARPLLGLPANPLFTALFLAGYGLGMKTRSRSGWIRTIRLFFKLRRNHRA